MGPLILDASVLIGLLDRADAHHERAVRHLDEAARAGRPLLIPASALAEALVVPASLGMDAAAREDLSAMGCTTAPLDQSVALLAAQLRAEHDRLRLPDALVLATARHLGGDLLTYDKRLARFA